MAKQFAIEKYVEQKNAWSKIFGQQPLSLANARDAQKIAEMLDSDLSPENLSCDGEVRGQALQTKRNFLVRAASELKALYPQVKMYEAEGWL